MWEVLQGLMARGVKIPCLAGARAGRVVTLYTPVEGEDGFYRERSLKWRELGERRVEVVLQAGARDCKYEVVTPLSDDGREVLVNALARDLEV